MFPVDIWKMRMSNGAVFSTKGLIISRSRAKELLMQQANLSDENTYDNSDVEALWKSKN